MCSMKIKIRRPRSCLAYFLWLLGILLSLVLLNDLYAKVRIFAAQAAALELAGKLGYTPADLLRSEVYHINDDIITGSYVCEAEFVFVTLLERPEVEARLLAARPETWPINSVIGDGRNFYGRLPLNVYDASGRRAYPPFAFAAKVWWLAPETTPIRQTPIAVWLQTSQVPAPITFEDRPIDGNIAWIRWPAGRYPPWVWC